MAADKNKALINQFLKKLDENRQAIAEFCAPRLTAHLPGISQPTDRDGFAQFVALFYQAFPDLCHTVDDQVVEGDRVVTRLTVQGTHRGPFQGVAATGKPVEFTDIMVTRIEGGKIMELWAQFDTLSLWQQLGLLSLA